MDLAFLVAYLAVVGVASWRARSLPWIVVATTVSVSVLGVLVNLAIDLGHSWTRLTLQFVLLAALVLVAAAAFMRRQPGGDRAPRWAGFVAVGIPVVAILAFLVIVMWFLAEGPAFLRPVSFLMGHATAEDNAKWLDFTAQYATGSPILQGVALGGPLQLFLTFVGTLMGVLSGMMLGGYNEVAVAANTVVMGSFLLAALAPLALAPYAGRIWRGSGSGSGARQVPWPLVWLGSLVLVAASLAVTGYGHLTFQYTLIVMALWSAVFLTGSGGSRGRLLISLAAAATTTVWLPLNAMAAVILIVWLIVFIRRLVRGAPDAVDPIGWGAWAVVAIGLFLPLWHSLSYVTLNVMGAAVLAPIGGALRGVAALAVRSEDGTVFSSPGGTEATGPILGVLAAASVIAAAWVLSRSDSAGRPLMRVALVPVGTLTGFAILVTLADFWVTGSGPHYGSLKFMFLAAVVALATTLPAAVLALDWPAHGVTLARWAAAGAVLALLMVDTLLPRALAATRPDQWSPPIPFNNSSGSYWYPAEVNGSADQPIADNPVACVYLPGGASVPSAILDSQLSDPQRVYNCSRLLAGLAGMDSTAVFVVDWLRREWLTNTRAWSEEYPNLLGLPDSVKAKKVILLDDGSNVIGLETIQSLLDRFGQFAGKTPEELAAMGIDPNAG